MMHVFDTLKASKVLLDAGFEQAQAEALAVTVRDAVTDNVATKDDLKIAKSELKEEISALRSELKEEIGAVRSELKEEIGAVRSEMKEMGLRLEAKIAELSRDLYKQLWVMGLGIVGLTVALIKLL